MIDKKKLVTALKCSLAVGIEHDCEHCEYVLREEVQADIPCPPDREIDGKLYWESCNTDRMAEECVKLLEEE